MKKRVLIVHNYYQIPGGEDTVVLNEKQLLEENGHQVFLYTRNNSELKNLGRFRKISLPFSTVFSLTTYREIKYIIKKYKIDVVHVHNTLNLISPSVYYAANSCKVPVIQTIHNFRLLCPGATFYREGKICEKCVEKGLQCSIKYKCYRKSMFQTMACVISTKFHRILKIYRKIYYICLTEFNKEKLLCLKQIPVSHVYVKPNFTTEISDLCVSEKKRNYFAFAGRLDEQKGIRILLEAWRILGEKAPLLLICGAGPEEKWCREFVEAYCKNTVKIMGFLPNEKVREIIAGAKALILPTQWYEGFPMTILEAYSVGTPVIGSRMGNVGDLILEGVTGSTFQYNSSSDLAEVIGKFSGYSSEEVKNYYKGKYTPQKNYQILNDIYEKICR